jgi:hypothetical protein
MNNKVIQEEKWYTSYIPKTNNIVGISILAPEGSEDKTALCVIGKFYILNGDHVEDFSADFLEEAMQHFRDNPSCALGRADEEIDNE